MKKIVFDVDDILWSLNEKSSKFAGIDRNKIITYSAKNNPLLTDDEKTRLIASYQNPDLFKDIKWYNGIERINSLDADVYINSNALSESAAELKRSQLKRVLLIPDEKIQINIIKPGETKKIIDNDTYIFVDDCPDNILNSNAEYNIMLECPWNMSDDETNRLRNSRKKIIRCKSLITIINVIEILLNDDSETKKQIDDMLLD